MRRTARSAQVSRLSVSYDYGFNNCTYVLFLYPPILGSIKDLMVSLDSLCCKGRVAIVSLVVDRSWSTWGTKIPWVFLSSFLYVLNMHIYHNFSNRIFSINYLMKLLLHPCLKHYTVMLGCNNYLNEIGFYKKSKLFICK